MTDKDISISSVGAGVTAQVGNITKPCYLILLQKDKKTEMFLAIDKPDLHDGCIQTKGFFCEENKSYQDIVNNYASLLTNIAKESIVEMMFPLHRVISIRNLVFKAK